MALLDAALALAILLAGAALLGTHHLLLIAAGLIAGGLALVVTHGHVVLRRGRPQAPAPDPAPREDARRVPAGQARAAVKETLDVAPVDSLAVAPMDRRTAASLILGSAGLFLFNAVFGVIAIWLALTALRRGTPGRWGRPGALTGLALGVADIVTLAVLLAGRVGDGGLHWG